jgi:hypothetical protein
MGLGRGSCIDQISDGFGLYQIELAIQHRPAGEFTGSSRPSSGGVKRRQQSARRQDTAMAGELDEILSGVTVGPGKGGVQTAINRLTVGVVEGRECRAAGRIRLESTDNARRDIERP